jgi:hypothetical protein
MPSMESTPLNARLDPSSRSGRPRIETPPKRGSPAFDKQRYIGAFSDTQLGKTLI